MDNPMEELYRAVIAHFEPYQPLAHDIKHGTRTAALARKIALGEGYDPDEAEAAGLLHDVGRTVKESTIPHGHEGAPIAREFLDKYTQFSDEAKERIVQAIYDHSNLHTEGKLKNILQDADKLDGLGAVGIDRAFVSNYHKSDYNPENMFPEDPVYGKTTSAVEQICLQLTWYDMLYTETAKKIGKERYTFMKAFLAELEREVTESTKS